MGTTSNLLTVSCCLLFVFHDGVNAAPNQRSNKEGTEFWCYVDVRPGAHIFYWLYHSYHVEGYRSRPLIIWLQGGPGASSCGYGNFELIGPLDLNLNERSTTWVKEANVLFIDSPVGAGFSYVDDMSLLTTDIQQVTDDLTELIKQFMNRHHEFKKIPLYVFGQSYGGKAAAHFSSHLYHEIRKGSVEANLTAFAMGNAWISPIDSTLTWGPLLYQMSLVDYEGMQVIQSEAKKAEEAALDGNWNKSSEYWYNTEMIVIEKTNGVSFYNLHKFDTRRQEDLLLMLTAGGSSYSNFSPASEEEDPLHKLMNGEIKQKIGIIPSNITYAMYRNNVFFEHWTDFMKDVIYVVQDALENSTLEVIVYQGQLDIICDVVGAMNWVQKMKSWSKLHDYNNATRRWLVNDVSFATEMYIKEFERFHFYWVLGGGHSVAKDKPMTSYKMMRRIIGERDVSITTTPQPITKGSSASPSTPISVLSTLSALITLAFLR